MKIAIIGLAVLACTGLVATAGDPPDPPPDLERALLEIVRGHSEGRETCNTSGMRTTIAFDAMTYQVHLPDRLGRMQGASKELGPRTGGVVIEIDALPGPYAGPMGLPQTFHGPYYATHCNELVENEKVHLVRARIGRGLPAALRGDLLERLGMTAHGKPDRDRLVIPVSLAVEPAAGAYTAGRPLLVSAILRNDLQGHILLPAFTEIPKGWSVETLRFQLTDVYRNGVQENLCLARPTGKAPAESFGAGTSVIRQGGSYRRRLDLDKWKIAGGWTPGTYDCRLRMDRIRVDRTTILSVQSAPFRVTVR